MSDQPPADRDLHRYAVLRHSDAGETHFDFLFEVTPEAPLITFRLFEWPLGGTQAATRLRDHRRIYLDYEGEIPGRGRVDRVAEGTLRIEPAGPAWLLYHPDNRPFLRFDPEESAASERWRVTPLECG